MPLPAGGAALPAPAHRDLLPAGLLAAAVLTGAAIVGGELLGPGLGWLAGLALPLALLVLYDFRLGVLALVLLTPVSASPLMPRAIGGITGLNPTNLVLLLTTAAALAALRQGPGLPWARLRPLLLLYVLPITVAGLIGAGHVGEIPAAAFAARLVEFRDAAGYLRDVLVKPLLLVLTAVLTGLAVARSRHAERFLLLLAAAATLPALLVIGFVAASGAGLDRLAGEDARSFLSPLGLHANDLGRMLAFAYALLLFSWAGSTRPAYRAALLAAIGVVSAALLLTFSRSAFAAFVLITLWFALTRRGLLALLALAASAVAAMLLPDAVFQRLLTGAGGGANALTAGRVDLIWTPLLPELLAHPLFGNGLWSTLWSTPLRQGSMLLVSHPHSAYLQALLDLGLAGSAALFAYFAILWRRFGIAAADNAALALGGLFRGARVALAAMFLAGLGGGAFTPGLEQVFLWLVIGIELGRPALRPEPAR